MKNKEYWITWAKAAGVRAVKTAAQTFVATIGTAAVLQDVNWVCYRTGGGIVPGY